MTQKNEFNAEEWDLVVEAPLLSALRVIAADRGGTMRESLSLARAYAEAREHEGSELLNELVASAPQVERGQVKSPDELRTVAEQRLDEALELVGRKATPEELEDYKRFILKLADTVAHAHKEGGFLGIGGKEVSGSEQTVLDELAVKLGKAASERPAPEA